MSRLEANRVDVCVLVVFMKAETCVCVCVCVCYSCRTVKKFSYNRRLLFN